MLSTKSREAYHIVDLLEARNIAASDHLIRLLKEYFDKRASLLNDYVRNLLMTADEAKEAFEELLPMYEDGQFLCKLPKNKNMAAALNRTAVIII